MGGLEGQTFFYFPSHKPGHELGTAIHAKFGINGYDMILDGFNGNIHLIPCAFVGKS